MSTTKYIVNNVTGQTINGQSVLPNYKVYTALLTQSGGDNAQFLTSGAVTEGVTYYIDGVGSSSDFSNVGGPSVGIGDVYFVATNSNVPNNWDGATLQYNTGAPTVKVLENTIGNIWFTYVDEGSYQIKSDGLFASNKVYTVLQLWGDDGVSPRTGYVGAIDNNTLTLDVRDGGGNYTSGVGINSNNYGLLTSIEIRVYN